MDSGKELGCGVIVIGAGAPSTYHVAPRTESCELQSSPVMSAGLERKKRGRRRKYKADESSGRVFSPSSAPPAAAKAYGEDVKLGVPRATSSEKKHKSKIGADKLGPRAVCIISGSGRVSNVTLGHPNSSGGVLTYEGHFEILSFTGSFTPTEMPEKYGRSGLMTITFSGADGRVVGGLVSGSTVAASPVKIVVASFLLGSSLELKPKKQFTVNASGAGGVRSSTLDIQGPNWTAIQTADKTRKSAADNINISLRG